MPTTDNSWMLSFRSEAIAMLRLTSRDDLSVRRTNGKDSGPDFLVAIREKKVETSRLFWVHVKGLIDIPPGKWGSQVRQLFAKADYYFPALALCVDVRTEAAGYAWLAEPCVVDGQAKLVTHTRPRFESFDNDSLQAIVNAVNAWYDALPRERFSHAS
jgi:hypothetical protein